MFYQYLWLKLIITFTYFLRLRLILYLLQFPDKSEEYPIHKILLAKPVMIIENLMNLEALVGVPSFDIFAFPMKLHAEAAPVRVVARVG